MWENIKSQECDKGCLGQTFEHKLLKQISV